MDYRQGVPLAIYEHGKGVGLTSHGLFPAEVIDPDEIWAFGVMFHR